MAIANIKLTPQVLAQFYAILSVVQFTTTHRVVGYCKHGANCKETTLLIAIIRCGKTNLNSWMLHLVKG